MRRGASSKGIRVGIVGLGMLGNAVALRLLDSGIGVTVYNRTAEKTAVAVGRGARAAASPGEASRDSDLVITIVKDAGAVRDVSFGEGGIAAEAHEGMVVADMSTVDPSESREITAEFQRRGTEKLDIPVMGGPPVAATGDLVMMASGDRKSFERCRGVLETVASKVFFLGDGGAAHSVKLAMNLQIAMLALALSEGITLVKESGVRPETFLEILNSTYFKTGMSQKKAYRMIDGSHVTTFTLSNMKKDIAAMTRAAESAGISLPMIKKAEEIYGNAAKDGFGEIDYTGIIEYIKKINGRE